MICIYFMTGTPKGSTKSGFMEKPGIEPATPGLQDICLSPHHGGFFLSLEKLKLFCGFTEYTPFPPGWFKICVLVVCREHPKAHRK